MLNTVDLSKVPELSWASSASSKFESPPPSRSTWSMVTDWSRRLGGRLQLLKSMNYQHFAIETRYVLGCWWLKSHHCHGSWPRNGKKNVQKMLMVANRFLGLEAEVTQENFYFNATKVQTSASAIIPTLMDGHQGFHCLRPGRGPERCLAKSKGRPHVNVSRWSLTPPSPPSACSFPTLPIISSLTSSSAPSCDDRCDKCFQGDNRSAQSLLQTAQSQVSVIFCGNKINFHTTKIFDKNPFPESDSTTLLAATLVGQRTEFSFDFSLTTSFEDLSKNMFTKNFVLCPRNLSNEWCCQRENLSFDLWPK